MMKTVKRIASLLLALCLLLALSACGAGKPTPQHAEKYVKAVLDLMCTGEYDKSVKLADAEEVAAARDESIDSMLKGLREQLYMSDEVAAEFREVLDIMFANAKYTVGKATPTDGGFDIPVTMEPLAFSDVWAAAIQEGVEKLQNDPAAQSMTENELMNELMRYSINVLREDLKNPHYAEGEVVHVRYYEMEKGLYGVNEQDGRQLGALLFR